MARGSTLIDVLNKTRAECRLSLNPAHNVQMRDSQVLGLQRIQEDLWRDCDWPHLRVHRDIPLAAGQRYYSHPTDIDIDRIEKVEVRYQQRWLDVTAGITPAHYARYDSDLGARGWPIARWQIVEDEQMEVWPIPSENQDPVSLEGTLRVWGIKPLAPFVEDTDTASLDDRMLALFYAAEHFAGNNDATAKLKLAAANKLYARLRGALMPARRFRMMGRNGNRRLLRGPPPVYYRVVS